MARPIPREAPVTRATFPVRSISTDIGSRESTGPPTGPIRELLRGDEGLPLPPHRVRALVPLLARPRVHVERPGGAPRLDRSQDLHASRRHRLRTGHHRGRALPPGGLAARRRLLPGDGPAGPGAGPGKGGGRRLGRREGPVAAVPGRVLRPRPLRQLPRVRREAGGRVPGDREGPPDGRDRDPRRPQSQERLGAHAAPPPALHGPLLLPRTVLHRRGAAQGPRGSGARRPRTAVRGPLPPEPARTVRGALPEPRRGGAPPAVEGRWRPPGAGPEEIAGLSARAGDARRGTPAPTSRTRRRACRRGRRGPG